MKKILILTEHISADNRQISIDTISESEVNDMPHNDCKKYNDMIYEYTADMLSEDDASDLMRHIDHCSACRNELERIRAVMNAASEIEDVPVPDELISALDARLEQTGKEIKNSRRQSYGSISGTVLSLAAAAALAIGMYSGGVFDKYLHSDDVFNNDTSYTDSQSTDRTEKSDSSNGISPSDNSSGATSDSPDNTSANTEQSDSSGISNRPNNSNNSAKSDKSSSSGLTDNSALGTPQNGANADNRNSLASEDNTDIGDSHPTFDDSQSENRDTDSSSAKSADKFYAANVAPESIDEGYGGADDYGISASSVENSGRSSGGGANSYDSDAQDGLMKQQSPTQTYSADATGDMSSADTIINVPSSCEIITANPKIYRDIYNVGSNGKFSLSASEWAAFKQLVTNNGDTLNIGGKTISNPDAYISVTITAK